MNTKFVVSAAVLAMTALAGCSTLNRADEMAMNKATGIEIRQVKDGVELRLPESALFDFGKATLTDKAAAVVKRSVVLINRSAKLVRVDGFTDNVGSLEYNQKLSLDRANAVASALVSQNVNPGRLSTRGLAFDNPVATNETAEGRAQNRRTEIILVGENLDTIVGK